MKPVSIAAIYGFVAVLIFIAISLLAWHVFPYPTGATRPIRTGTWMTHLVAEKTASFLICGIVAEGTRQERCNKCKAPRLGVLQILGELILFPVFASS
jgi:hypothetical protein